MHSQITMTCWMEVKVNLAPYLFVIASMYCTFTDDELFHMPTMTNLLYVVIREEDFVQKIPLAMLRSLLFP